MATTKVGVCIPVDVELLGVGRVRRITPPATDSYVPPTDPRSSFHRIVLRPQRRCVTVELSRGRCIRVSAWANRTDISPACTHDARARDLERRLEALWAFVRGRDLVQEAEAHLAEWDPEVGMTRTELRQYQAYDLTQEASHAKDA